MSGPSPTISVDSGSHSHLAVCTVCGWRSMHATLPAAWYAAAKHAHRVHSNLHRYRACMSAAANAARRAERRGRAGNESTRAQDRSHGPLVEHLVSPIAEPGDPVAVENGTLDAQ